MINRELKATATPSPTQYYADEPDRDKIYYYSARTATRVMTVVKRSKRE